MTSAQRDRGELHFWDHLDELRARVLRSIAYICAGAIAGWIYREGILLILQYPAQVAASRLGTELPFRVFEAAEGFVIAIQVALLSGVIIASPLVFWEIWRFIEPALENNERKYAIVVLPFASALFLGGIVFCYYVSPNAFAFLFRMNQSVGAGVELKLKPYLWFIMRLLIAFGLAFELPLVTMFLGWLGIVNSRQLLAWWRYAIVAVFGFAAIVTPTVDPVNMAILAGPMLVLYFISILLVHIVQKKRKTADDEADQGFDSEQVYGDAAQRASSAEGEFDRETEELYERMRHEEEDDTEEDADIPPPDDDLMDETDVPPEDQEAPDADKPSEADNAGEFYGD